MMSVGAILVRPNAYFGLIEFRTTDGKEGKQLISKNNKQEGYQTVKLLEKTLKERCAIMERSNYIILRCTVFQSETVVVAHPSTAYELKP